MGHRPSSANSTKIRTMQTAVPASLALASIGQALVVLGIKAPSHAPEWASWLEEIGFLPGESVSVMARGLPGADPLVVRIGHSTFALRRAEAECIAVGHAARTAPSGAEPAANDRLHGRERLAKDTGHARPTADAAKRRPWGHA